MKILHKQFGVVWSWTEIAKQLYSELAEHSFSVEPSNIKTRSDVYDVILTQQAIMLVNVKEKYKTITRLGSNSIFDGRYNMRELTDNIKQCFAVIATNKYLYETAKRMNPNTFLIPNGLDINEWGVLPEKKGKFTVGFVGNISTPDYREYKGYDFIEQSCKQLKVELKTALYRDKQIPHEDMREKFYSAVSCIVHPTKGEGSSNTIMEALACGIPVITTRAAGFHGEMLEDGVNVLFCERSTDSVKECISRLKEDPKLCERLRINGRKFAQAYHDIKTIAKQYDVLFQACHQANMNRKHTGGGMKIKYTGPKPKKTVIYGNKQYVFDPICTVFEEEAVKFLLDPARKGLFEVVRDVPQVKVDIPAPLPAGTQEKKEPDMTEADYKKLVEVPKFKCQQCEFVATSNIGLISHMRHKHPKPKETKKRGKK